MSTKLPQEETFTCPLKRFINRYLLGSTLDRINIDPADAIVLAAKDKEEKYIHVQFESLVGEQLDEPIVWHIKEWKTYYLRWKLDRERVERERRERCIDEENAQRLVRAMVLETGLTDEESKKAFYKLARKNVIGRKSSVEDNFDIKFDKG